MAAKKKTTKKKTTKRRPAAKKKATKKKATKKKTAKKKTAKKKGTKKKGTKKKGTKKKGTKKKATKKKTTRKKATRKKATKKKATKKKTTKRRPTAKKKTTKRRPAAKKKATKRRPAAKKTTKRRPAARKKTATRRPAAKKRPNRTSARTPRAAPLRGVSQFRCYLRELDKAISRADRWLSVVDRQSTDLTADFDDKLRLIAKLDEALTEDQKTIDAVRGELGKIQGVTPAISALKERIAQAAGTVGGMREDLQQIARTRGVENLLEWARGSANDLLAKASCVSTAARFGASTRSCGTRLSVNSAEEILDAARNRDFPALAEWVVTAQTPLVPGGSIPPTSADNERAKARIDRTLGPPPVRAPARVTATQPTMSAAGSRQPPALTSPRPARAPSPVPTGGRPEQGSLDLADSVAAKFGVTTGT